MKRRMLLCLAILSVATSSALAATMYSIDPIGSDTTTTVFGMTPDGAYVVGQSGSANGVLWDASTHSHGGTAFLQASVQALSLNGVGYRTVNGNTELTVAGVSQGNRPAAWSKVAGAWTLARRENSSNTGTMNYNALASPGTNTDYYYAFKRSNTDVRLFKGTGSSPDTVTFTSFVPVANGAILGVSAAGCAVGYSPDIQSSPAYKARKFNFSDGTMTTIAGLTGSAADYAWGVDPTGTKIVGASTMSTDTPLWRPWMRNGTTTTALPVLTGSTGNSFAYAISADGKYAVGVNVQTGTTERAVLWDMSDANSANWTIIDLTTEAGTALGDFSILSRATCIGKNANGQLVIGGFGMVNSLMRGYVLTIPEPATMTLLALGGLAILRRRR